MTFLKKTIAMTALVWLIVMMCGCASSNLVDIWHDPTFQARPLGKIMVIAVRKNAAKRRIWEDAFTGALARHGVIAKSSYGEFPDAPPDTTQVAASVQANGYDGILAILRLPTETTTQYVRGYVSTEQELRYSNYWQRYLSYYREIDHPGYTDTQTVDIRAIDVTTTGNDGRLIWSATSRTPDPTSVTDVEEGIVSLVISGLARRNIIGPKK